MDSLNPYQPPESLEPSQAEPDEEEANDPDLPPNAREEDAARALKAVILGILFCPLQLYAALLLFQVLISNERLRDRYFWYAVGAAVILIPYAAFVGVFGLVLFRN